jgi:hypothetical protein
VSRGLTLAAGQPMDAEDALIRAGRDRRGSLRHER